jgi:DNA polymerase-3 subunit beta
MTITGEVTVKAAPFAAAVAWAVKWIGARPAAPIGLGVALEVGDGKLTVTTYNENATARATVLTEENLTDTPAGIAIVSGRLLGELAATFRGNQVVRIGTAGNGHLMLTVGRWVGTMPTFSEDDWPGLTAELPSIGSVDGDQFAAAIARVGVANLKDPDNTTVFRQMFLGFGDETGDSNLTVYATDRYRVAKTVLPWTPDAEGAAYGRSATPYGTNLIDAAASFTGPGRITIGLHDGGISLTSPARSLVMRLGDPGPNGWPAIHLDGNFAQAQNYAGLAVLEPAEVAMPLKRAAIVRGKEGPVKLRFTDGTLTIASSEKDLDQDGNEQVDVDYTGESGSIATNPQWLAEALGSVPGDKVEVRFEVGEFTRRPIVLTSPNDPNWQHAIMPMVVLS